MRGTQIALYNIKTEDFALKLDNFCSIQSLNKTDLRIT